MTRIRRRELLIVISFLFFVGIPLTYQEFGRAGLEAYSIISTSLLSLGLVVLYYEQHSVLKSQEEPLLEVSEFAISDDFQYVEAEISNFGGGPATSLNLNIEFYELDGSEPIDNVSGLLNRVEEVDAGIERVTRSSSILPNEVGIPFEIQSESRIPMGGVSGTKQRSLSRILHNELEDRDVLYGKVVIQYNSVFEAEQYVADFSLKFTIREGDIQCENFTYLPWEEGFPNYSLGG